MTVTAELTEKVMIAVTEPTVPVPSARSFSG